MELNWTHAGSSLLASFLACLVECVEALTVILAVGSVRGWRGALSGAGAAIGVLLVMVALLGKALTHIPLQTLQLFVGVLLLLFGFRWLRKAILRSAGLSRFTMNRQSSQEAPLHSGRLGKVGGGIV